MVDNTKVEIRDVCGKKCISKFLKNEQTFDNSTKNNVEIKRSVKYENIMISETFSDKIFLTGSFHKFAHNGTNHTDFTLKEFKDQVYKFADRFEFEPSSAFLRNFEFGVNIPFSKNTILDNLLLHKFKPFYDFNNGIGKSVEYQHYLFKIYEKLMYNRIKPPTQIMRFEKKIKRMIDVKNVGLVSLSDLFDERKYQILCDDFLSCFDEILMFEPTVDVNLLRGKKKEFALQIQTDKYWNALTNERKKRFEAKNEAIELFDKYGVSDTKQEIRELLNQKLHAGLL